MWSVEVVFPWPRLKNTNEFFSGNEIYEMVGKQSPTETSDVR